MTTLTTCLLMLHMRDWKVKHTSVCSGVQSSCPASCSGRRTTTLGMRWLSTGRVRLQSISTTPRRHGPMNQGFVPLYPKVAEDQILFACRDELLPARLTCVSEVQRLRSTTEPAQISNIGGRQGGGRSSSWLHVGQCMQLRQRGWYARRLTLF